MFHPGRRKRRQIMYDLAVGKSFCLKKDERKRFTYALRIALEAVVECDSAYSGKANLTCANVAVQIATDSSYNTSRDAVRRLIDLKYIFDDRRGKNKYIRIPEKTKKYLRRLDNLENRINKVVLREDGYIDCDVNSELKKLKRLKIYIGKSDSEMDEDMRGEVDLKAEADGRKKSERNHDEDGES